jgi:eukaryotic-like serine/threonine-protein kinase
MSEGSSAPVRAGRYSLHAEIASGGMATVHYGRMVGAHGFSRVVAIKRMLPRLARDPHFHAMFVDEARLASRVQHPNVVSILDVVDAEGEVMIVMEYVRGPALSTLLDRGLAQGTNVPVPLIANIGCAMLAGLHAAHEARDRRGRTLGIVHRDVSPQNVLVGIDGTTRIMDFGIARAAHLLHASHERELTGKVCYMAPEQFLNTGVDRRTDIFATAVTLWGALAGRRLFRGGEQKETIDQILRCEVPSLAEFRDDVPPSLEAALGQALNPDRSCRYDTAEAFAGAIEAATTIASTRAVAEWVKKLAGSTVEERDQIIVHIEKTSTAVSFVVPGGMEGSADGATAADGSSALTADWVRPPSDEPLDPTLTDADDRSRVSTATLLSADQAPPLPVAAGGKSPWTRAQLAGLGVVGSAALVSLVALAILLGREQPSPAPMAQPPPPVLVPAAPAPEVAPTAEPAEPAVVSSAVPSASVAQPTARPTRRGTRLQPKGGTKPTVGGPPPPVLPGAP